MSTSERVAALARASADAATLKGQGKHATEEGAEYHVDAVEVQRLIEGWSETTKRAAQQMIEQYGPPNEATPTKLLWYRNGPWKRTLLTRDEVVHDFPAPHVDFLAQFIDYRVPVQKLEELSRFDGSLLVDRTAGEVAGRCDSEAASFVSLNLMHEIVTGRMTAEQARKALAESKAAFSMGRPTPMCEGFLFALPHGVTADPDQAIMGVGAMARHAVGKVKDVITGRDEQP